MKINHGQLSSELSRGLKPLYLVSGDEILLVQESLTAIRAAARQHGFASREVFSIEARFNWQNVLLEANSLSLFADKKIIELRFKQGKFSKEDKDGLEQLLTLLNPDLLVLMSLPRLESGVNKLKLYKQIEDLGTALIIWPIERAKLPAFIRQRLQTLGLSASQEAIELLADNTEGNLLATAQTIEKLYLLAPQGEIDASLMAGVANDASRYSVFDYVDKLLQGDLAKALKSLRGLEQEGEEPTLIVWAVSKELRLLYRLQYAIEQGDSLNNAMRSEFILPMRQALVRQALARSSCQKLLFLLKKAQYADQCIKGLKKDAIWRVLEQLSLRFCQ